MPSDGPDNLDNQRMLINALLDGSRFPRASSVRLVETHISWVLLAGRCAYKIKKAVDLGFLNFTDLSSRHYYCKEELRLNQRLAPQIYLDVIPVGGTPHEPALNALPAIEYAVRMKRFQASRELGRLAAHGKLLPRHMDRLATTVAHFHLDLPLAEEGTAFGSPDSLFAAISDVLGQLQTLLKNPEDEATVTDLRKAIEKEYAVRKEHLAQRQAQGFIRECHGDLHLGNIVLIGEQPIPFDGIEFNPALRWIDMMNEIAFTIMDLLRYSHPELAYRFLNAYLEITGDYSGVPLLRFYIAYRGAVRAMVSAIRSGQKDLSRSGAICALAESRHFLALAGQYLAHRHPAMIIMHGLPGSGKSTFAQTAMERLHGIRIRSDVERKRLFGLAALDDSRSLPADIYNADATRRTYEHLRARARELLMAGFPVIVDAAFLRQNERDYFHALAQELGVPFAIVSIKADHATLRARIIRRLSARKDASEAGLAVLEQLQDKQETLSCRERARTVEFVSEESASHTGDGAWSRLMKLLSQ